MGNPSEVFILIALLFVIVIQAIERFFFAEQVSKERSRMVTALLSKDLTEYTQAIRVEKEAPTPQFIESDEVNLADADDSVFDKFIKHENE